MSDEKPPTPLTRAQRKLLDASGRIFGEMATQKDAAYLPRELVQVTLPHKNPGNVPIWQRTNGNLTVAIQPGWNIAEKQSYGYPYGTIPRLLLFWITTEAIRTKNHRLELGNSLSGFMNELGLTPSSAGAGKRSDATRLRDQMRRLFNASISFVVMLEDDNRCGEGRINMHIAPKSELWWSRKNPEQASLWGSWIELGYDFYNAITEFPIPADMRALKALKRSPLALDLYAWLTYESFRAHRGEKVRFESWMQLHSHLGGEYQNSSDFRRKAKAALVKIKTVYPGLRLGDRQGGIQVLPESWPAIQPRNLTIDGSCRWL